MASEADKGQVYFAISLHNSKPSGSKSWSYTYTTKQAQHEDMTHSYGQLEDRGGLSEG